MIWRLLRGRPKDMLISWIFAIPPTYFLHQHHTRACADSEMSLHFTGGIALFRASLSASAVPSYSENTSCPYPVPSLKGVQCAKDIGVIDKLTQVTHPALITNVR